MLAIFLIVTMAKNRAKQPAAGEWLQHLLLQMVDRALFDAQDLPAHPEAALHHLRLRMKKADALLRLGRSILPKKCRLCLRSQIKQIKNEGGDQRDAHVVAKLASQLGRKQQLCLPTSPHTPPPIALHKLPGMLKKLHVDIAEQTFDGLSWQEVQQSYKANYRAARRQMKKAGKSRDPEDFHRWRKRVKALYYQSQALYEWLPHRRKRLHRTRKLGKWLGREQDLALLEHTAVPQGAEWTPLIAKARGIIRPQILKLGDQLFDASPRQFARWHPKPD